MSEYTAVDAASKAAGFSRVTAATVVTAIVLALAVTWVGDIPGGEDAIETWLYISLAFVVGVGLFTSGFGEYRRRSLVANTPTSKVRSLAMGTVELQGSAKARERDLLESPITRTDCVLYRYEVEEYRRSGDDSRWVTVDSERQVRPFHLDDGTGDVLVDPEGADLRLPRDERIEAEDFDDLPEPAQEFVRENDEVDVQDGWFDNDRRYTEWRIEPDQTVYVFGEALPREGEASTVNSENAVINEDRSTPMFVVSDQRESELLSSMTRRTVGLIVGGFLLAVGGFAALVWYVGLL